jgi:hypothetical protein
VVVAIISPAAAHRGSPFVVIYVLPTFAAKSVLEAKNVMPQQGLVRQQTKMRFWIKLLRMLDWDHAWIDLKAGKN